MVLNFYLFYWVYKYFLFLDYILMFVQIYCK